MTIMPVGSDDGAPPPQSANQGAAVPSIAEIVGPNDLPDYYPPILQSGNIKADYDGNVWILPSTTTQAGGGLLYDVVNRKGELALRVRSARRTRARGIWPKRRGVPDVARAERCAFGTCTSEIAHSNS